MVVVVAALDVGVGSRGRGGSWGCCCVFGFFLNLLRLISRSCSIRSSVPRCCCCAGGWDGIGEADDFSLP